MRIDPFPFIFPFLSFDMFQLKTSDTVFILWCAFHYFVVCNVSQDAAL